MAVRFDAASDRLLRTTDLPNYASAYTVMLWVYPTTVTGGTWYSIAGINDNAHNNKDELNIVDSSPSKFSMTVYAGGSWLGDNAGTTTPVANTWYHLAMVRESATSLKLYVNGSLEATETDSVAGRAAATRFEVGAQFSSDDSPFAGRVAGIKVWSAGLNSTEVNAEKNILRAVRQTNLYAWYPTYAGSGERARDYSGNGRNWTEGGTLTDEANPQTLYGAINSFQRKQQVWRLRS